jgi:NDP-sugar pyrophosphorylase family protein
VLEPEIFKYIPTNTYYDFSYNVFPALVNRNLYAYKMKPNELFWWIDSEKDLKYTEKTFNDSI